MKNDALYINQIQDAIAKLEQFTAGMERGAFEADQKTQSAVIMQLMIIGEVAKKISEETKSQIDAPWKEIVGFRDVAIHNYFSMDLDIVWETIQNDIPELKKKLNA